MNKLKRCNECNKILRPNNKSGLCNYHNCFKKNVEKRKHTCFKNYGVQHALQNCDLLHKAQISSGTKKKYKNTKIWYQASYELDFLENYYERFKDEIERGPSIKYKFEKKNKIYHPDFYIPSLNLIIEIKGLYWHNKFKERDITKKKATIANGFNYIMILEKDYKEFDKLFNS